MDSSLGRLTGHFHNTILTALFPLLSCWVDFVPTLGDTLLGMTYWLLWKRKQQLTSKDSIRDGS
jgi:hypothetical protein